MAGLGTLGWFLYSLYDGISLKCVIKGFKGKLEQKVKKKKKNYSNRLYFLIMHCSNEYRIPFKTTNSKLYIVFHSLISIFSICCD